MGVIINWLVNVGGVVGELFGFWFEGGKGVGCFCVRNELQKVDINSKRPRLSLEGGRIYQQKYAGDCSSSRNMKSLTSSGN